MTTYNCVATGCVHLNLELCVCYMHAAEHKVMNKALLKLNLSRGFPKQKTFEIQDYILLLLSLNVQIYCNKTVYTAWFHSVTYSQGSTRDTI